MSNILKGLQLNELSNEKLGQYKKAAGADAKKADSEGDYKRGDKRFSGIVKATKKQFANDEKQLKEFAADDGDGGSEEDTLRKYAKMWYNGDDTTQQQVEQILDRMGWEIGELESEEGGAFVIQAGDEHGDSYVGFTASDLTDEVDEAYNNYHANRTGFIRPKRDLSGEGEPQGMFMVMIDGRPWKEFTSNVAFARAKTLADKYPTKKIQVRWPTGQLNTVTEDELDENCWKGYHKEGNKELFGKTVPNCVKNTNEEQELEEYGDTAKGQKMLDKVHNRAADRVTSKQADKDPAYARKAQQTQDRAWDRLAVKEQGVAEGSGTTPKITFAQQTPGSWTRIDILVDGDVKFQAVKTMGPGHWTIHDQDGEVIGNGGNKTELKASVLNYLSKQGVAEESDKQFAQRMKKQAEQPPTKGMSQKEKEDKGWAKPKEKGVAEGLSDTQKKIEDTVLKLEQRLKFAKTPEQWDNIKNRIERLQAGLNRSKQGVAEGSLEQRVADKKKNNPLQASVKQSKYGYSALVTYKTGETAWHGGAYWQTPELAMGHAKAFINGYPHLEQESAQRFIDKNRDGIVQQGVAEEKHSCPHCGGEMVSEELMNEKKDACYYKVKSRYKVWPSAYASGALVKCRKKGADSWGNGGKKNESSILEGIDRADENLHQWFKEKWVRFGPDGKIRGDCARGDDSEGKPKCLPQSKAQSLGKKGRASAAARKRREDPNPERSGKAINVNTKKKANEEALDEKWSQKYKDSINCSNPKGFSQRAHCQGKNK